LDLVRILQCVLVGIEDTHVLIRISVKLFADLRKSVAGFDRVTLATFAATATRRGAYRAARIDGEISCKIVRVVGIYQFDLFPNFVLHFFRRRRTSNEQFVSFNVQVRQPHVLALDRVEHRLILRLQFIETLLRVCLSLSGCRAASKHFVKKSHFSILLRFIDGFTVLRSHVLLIIRAAYRPFR
jgi:hypothetical protein